MIHTRALIGFIAAFVFLACSDSSDKAVETSNCSSSVGSFDIARCQEIGAKNGCEISRVATMGCSFERCDTPTSCEPSATTTPTDAGSTVDAAPDPSCASAQGDGFFTAIPPCADYNTTNINGTTRYACRCGSCACGYVCGSIPLSVGGTLGGVCAPP